MNLKSLLPLAIQAAEEACTEIMEVYVTGDFQVEAKGDNSPLTLADKKAHIAITKILEQTQLPILSEEGKDIPFDVRKNWEYFWMVDPLDGTKEFLKKNGEFTVNIALIHNNTPVLGVVAIPVEGKVYFAAKGSGAFLKAKGEITKLADREPIDLSKTGLRLVGSRSHMSEDTEAFIATLKEPSFISVGSSLKFLLLASGEADIYPRYAPTMEWDTAAAHAVVNEVNVKVMQFKNTAELVYNKENLLNPHFLCC